MSSNISQFMSSTSKPSSSTGYLSGWKWQVLRKRREFLLPLQNIVLILAWLMIFRSPPANSTKRLYQVTSTLSLFFVTTHAIIVASLLTSVGMKVYQRDNGIQAKRLCYWCLLSTLLVIGFLPEVNPVEEAGKERDMAAVLFECVSMAIFQHLGTSQLCSFLIFVASIISIIAMISRSANNFDAAFTCLIILGEYLLYASSTMQHLDYKHRYSQTLEFDKSKANKMVLSVQDLASTLARLDEAISTIAPDMMFERTDVDNQWRWTKEAATLQVQRLHVLGFKHTISESSDETDYNGESRFGFYQTCRNLFAMLETSVGFALPLFLDVDQLEIYITGPQEIFEITLFLLIYESVILNRTGFCKISCENDSEMNSTYTFSVSITSESDLHNDKYDTSKNKIEAELFDDSLDCIPKDLYASDNLIGKSSAWTKMAKFLAVRHLNCTKWPLPEIEYNSNFMTTKQVFKIKDNLVSSMDQATNTKVKTSKHCFLFVNNIESFLSIQKCLEILQIPFKFCAGPDLKEESSKASYSVAVIHESQLKNFEALMQDLPKVVQSVIVLFDNENSSSDNLLHVMGLANVKRIRTGENWKNVFERIREILEQLEPRPISFDDNEVEQANSNKRGGRSNNRRIKSSNTGQNKQCSNWLLLLEKINKEMLIEFHNPSYYVDNIQPVIDKCRARFKLEATQRKGDFEPILDRISDLYPNMPKDLDSKQKIAKVIVDEFLGTKDLDRFQEYLKDNKYNEIAHLCLIYMKKAEEFHQTGLFNCFAALQEVCIILDSNFPSLSSAPDSLPTSVKNNSSESKKKKNQASIFNIIDTEPKPGNGQWVDAKSGLKFQDKIEAIVSDMIGQIEGSIWSVVVDGS